MPQVRRFLEMIRFSHTVFALPFALFSAALAWFYKRDFSFLELGGILACMVCARSAAMAFNRLADRQLDAGNPRTASRHLPAGLLSAASVWTFTLVCCAGFVASSALFLAAEPSNPWPLYLSVPVLLFLLAYSYTKRFTALAHFWLGAALLLAPLAAWIAIRGPVDLATPLVLGLAVCFWVAGFDIIYACQDAAFDRQAGLHSMPARLGVPAALRCLQPARRRTRPQPQAGRVRGKTPAHGKVAPDVARSAARMRTHCTRDDTVTTSGTTYRMAR